MADREPVAWITVHGNKVPIFEGESKGDAINRAIAKSNADKKEKQIADNKRQSEIAEGQKLPPRRLYLNDIKAEDFNKTSDVINLRTRERFKVKDGTKVTEVHAFAGKGCLKPFEKAQKYADRYGKTDPKLANPSDWQHCSGKATITNGSKTLVREVHWVQGVDGKVREAFIKEFPKSLKKRK